MHGKSDYNTIGVLSDNTKGKHMQDFGVPGYSDAVKVLQSKVLGKSDYNDIGMLGDNTKDKHMQDFAVAGYSDAVNVLKELQGAQQV